jgi:hypothetical protein
MWNNSILTQSYEYCDISPWVHELLSRMEEARQAGTNVVNLSYTHQRGFFPNQIVRRKGVRELLKQGWSYIRDESPPSPRPTLMFMPVGLDIRTLEWCDTTPWEQEIALREAEAFQAGRWIHNGDTTDQDVTMKWFPGVVELTGHPRGDIPDVILKRIKRRKDPNWRVLMANEIDKLNGEANQDEGRAKGLEQRAEAFATKPNDPGDPTALLQSAAGLRQRAEELRRTASYYKLELGER